MHQFIIDTMKWNGVSREFVVVINQKWPEFLSDFLRLAAYRHNEANQELLDNFVLQSLYYSSIYTLTGNNIANHLANFIQNNPRYFEFGQSCSGERTNNPNIVMLIRQFHNLGVKFKSINYEVSNKELFKKVYENHQYELNKDNIWLMLKTMYGLEETDDFVHRNFSIIMSILDSPLAKYILENIIAYVQVILSCCEGSFTDDEQTVISLLNHSDVNLQNESVCSYLKRLKTKVSTLSDINSNEMRDQLLNLDLCKNTEENVLSYFDANGMDESLVLFINRHEPLSYTDAVFSSEKSKTEFLDAVVANSSINDDCYTEIVNALNII